MNEEFEYIKKKFLEKKHLFPLPTNKWAENKLPSHTRVLKMNMTTNQFLKKIGLPIYQEKYTRTELLDLFKQKKDIVKNIRIKDWPKHGLPAYTTIQRQFEMTAKEFKEKYILNNYTEIKITIQTKRERKQIEKILNDYMKMLKSALEIDSETTVKYSIQGGEIK